MHKPLISIGLPVVKSDYLTKCIESCLNQTYDNIEIIVQNNAKQQKIKSEIRHLVSSFSDYRIRYVEIGNQLPMVANWNSILEKANGEYFSILCDDDFWESTFLEEMIQLINKFYGTNLFHSRIAKVNENDDIISLSNIYPTYESGLDFIYHRLNGSREMYLSDFLVKTKNIREIGGFMDFPDGWGSDTFTWFNIALEGGVAYSSKVLVNYRVSDINTTNSKRIKNKFRAVDRHIILLKEILSRMNFSENKFDIVTKNNLEIEIIKYSEVSKKHILYNLLRVNYSLPNTLSHFFAFIYLFVLRWQNKRNVKKK